MSVRTVLVVDASPLSARRVREALRAFDLRVEVAVDEAHADAFVDDGGITVALVALTFPGGNGYDFARRVKERNPEAVVFLLCGGFEVFNGERADKSGVYGRINRPFTEDALLRHLEAALGPLAAPDAVAAPAAPVRREVVEVVEVVEVEAEPADGIAAYEGPIAPEPDVPPARPAVADERIASFLPREWRTHPPVRVDPEIIGPALERAILEILPEVVEVVLSKAVERSPAFRDLVEVAVDEAVRARIGPIAKRVIRERLAEIEAGGDDPA